MFALCCLLTIGSLPALDFVHEIEIESSWQKFTDTATITLPRKIKAASGKQLPDLIRVGDAVTIQYGYDGNLRTEFTGFVSELKPGTPFQIKCEDQMWALKRATFSQSWRSVSLRTLLTYIRDHTTLDFDLNLLGKQELGKYQINQATGAQVFEDLKKRFGVSVWFRQGVLCAGNPYAVSATTHRYAFRQNIIDADLAYTQAEDVALHFRATSVQADGKKIQVDYDPATDSFYTKVPTKAHKGDPKPAPGATAASQGLGKGELRTLVAAPNLTAAQLRDWVRGWANQHQYTGYRGGLTGFGVPLVEHGDIARVEDPDYPERAGAYYIDSVTKAFGINGSRRRAKLGPKVPNS